MENKLVVSPEEEVLDMGASMSSGEKVTRGNEARSPSRAISITLESVIFKGLLLI